MVLKKLTSIGNINTAPKIDICSLTVKSIQGGFHVAYETYRVSKQKTDNFYTAVIVLVVLGEIK